MLESVCVLGPFVDLLLVFRIDSYTWVPDLVRVARPVICRFFDFTFTVYESRETQELCC